MPRSFLLASRPLANCGPETVLVIEYGQIEDAPGVFDPPQTVWGSQHPNTASTWGFASLPNTQVKNRTAAVFAGKVVGGSSAANGMFFDRGSRHDYDAWKLVASPEFDKSGIAWDWKGLFPFFRKVGGLRRSARICAPRSDRLQSVTFTEPSAGAAQQYGYTWDMSAYGGSTPIHSTMPPFLWGDHGILRGAWKDMGIRSPRECAGGDKEGVCWVPISEHPLTARRSHSGLGHYADVVGNGSRPNYDLLVGHQVTRILYPKGPKKGPPVVEARALATNALLNITARAEVVLSAGAFHTPTILMRSGIGPAPVIAAARVPLVLDLPGVGSNFQDHAGPAISWNCEPPPPHPSRTAEVEVMCLDKPGQ